MRKWSYPKKEMLLLESLMTTPPMRVINRDELLSKLWDNYLFVDENTLNVYVTRVRRKLGSRD
jgi:two-component system, OmpR family, response regulator YxdJ